MAKKLATLTLASMMLAGCGAPPQLSSQSRTTVQAQDVNSVKKAQRLATEALRVYDDLRNDWIISPTDDQKDQIDGQMLLLLFRALEDIRTAVSSQAGARGNDTRTVFDIATSILTRCEPLRAQREKSQNITEQRWLANLMEIYLLDALNRVVLVQPEVRARKLALPNDMSGARPTPPVSKPLEASR